MNNKKPLTLDFKTFTSSTGLDYNNGEYVSHLSPEAIKAELAKIVTNLSYLDKTHVLKNSFPVAWRILFIFVIQFLDGNYSSTKQINYIQQMIAYCLMTGTKVDIREIIDRDLTVTPTLPKSQGPKASGAISKKRKHPKSKKTPIEVQVTPPFRLTEDSKQSHSVSSGNIPDPQDPERKKQLAGMGLPSTQLDEGTHKSQILLEGTNTDPKDSGRNVQPADKGLPSTVSNKGTRKVKMKYLRLEMKDEEVHHTNEEETPSPSPNKDQPESSHTQNTESDSDSSCLKALKKYEMSCHLLKDNWYNIFKKSLGYFITELLKRKITGKKLGWSQLPQYADFKSNIRGISWGAVDVVKEDHALNKKVIKATEAYTKNSTNLTKLLSLIKRFDFQGLKSLVESLQASALRQDEHLAEWAKSSTSMAWNLGLRLTSIESTQVTLRSKISSLKQDSSDIKSVMTKIFKAFKGQSSLAPSSSVPTRTLSITEGPATVRGNFKHAATKEPHSDTEGENDDIET
ncbi:hypothetical protein Tco_0951166 [Tanacetum coccineum]|uniref:Uncharacterized protein n=1 Tax=Tanacetum coccineum TaxID=301880 RepID=A0ABQ5DW38_9ASTR